MEERQYHMPSMFAAICDGSWGELGRCSVKTGFREGVLQTAYSPFFAPSPIAAVFAHLPHPATCNGRPLGLSNARLNGMVIATVRRPAPKILKEVRLRLRRLSCRSLSYLEEASGIWGRLCHLNRSCELSSGQREWPRYLPRS